MGQVSSKKQAKREMLNYLDTMYVRYLNILRYDATVTANLTFTTLDTETEMNITISDIYKRVEAYNESGEGLNYEHMGLEYSLDMHLSDNAVNVLGVLEYLNYRYTAYSLKDVLVRYEDVFTGNTFVGIMKVEFYRGSEKIEFEEFYDAQNTQGAKKEPRGTYITLNNDPLYSNSTAGKNFVFNYATSVLGLDDIDYSDTDKIIEIEETIKPITAVRTANTRKTESGSDDVTGKNTATNTPVLGVTEPVEKPKGLRRNKLGVGRNKGTHVVPTNNTHLGVREIMLLDGREVVRDLNNELVFLDELPTTHPIVQERKNEEKVRKNSELYGKVDFEKEFLNSQYANAIVQLESKAAVYNDLISRIASNVAVSFVKEMPKSRTATYGNVSETVQELSKYDSSGVLKDFGTPENLQDLKDLHGLGSVKDTKPVQNTDRVEQYYKEEKEVSNIDAVSNQRTLSNTSDKEYLEFRAETTVSNVRDVLKKTLLNMLKSGYKLIAYDNRNKVYYDNTLYLVNESNNTVNELKLKLV